MRGTCVFQQLCGHRTWTSSDPNEQSTSDAYLSSVFYLAAVAQGIERANSAMKFGKQILSQQISGWGPYYLDYKFLKKIINSLEKGRITDAALLATGMRPSPPDSGVVGVGSMQSPPLQQQPLQSGQSELEDDSHNDSTTRRGEVEAATQILLGATSSGDGPDELKLHRAAFFFKLERELEKVSLHCPKVRLC